jgi:hypothetical protein
MNTPTANRSNFIHMRLPEILLTIAGILLALALYLTIANPSAPSPTPPTTPPIRGTDAIDTKTAWGADLDIYEVQAAIDDNHVFVLETVTPDGKYLLGTIYPKALTSKPGNLVLIDVQTQQITNIHELPQPTTQVRKADIDDDWITWMEADYADTETYGWDIFAYNRKTGEAKKLAGQPTPAVCSGCGTATNLVAVTHGLLFWEQVSYSSRPPSTYFTFNSTDLSTGVTKQIPGIQNPSIISWPYIVWLETTLSSEPQPTHTVVLHLRNMETGETKSIPSSETEHLLALYDNILTWANNSGEIYTTDLNNAQLNTLLNADNMAPIQMNNRLILLYSTPLDSRKLFAWDLKQRRLVQLEDVPRKPITTLVKDSIVLWTTGTAANKDEPGSPITGFPSSPDQIIYILNTDSLPTTNP